MAAVTMRPVSSDWADEAPGWSFRLSGKGPVGMRAAQRRAADTLGRAPILRA